MILVDTWAWVALAVDNDQYHAAAKSQHHLFSGQRRSYVTTDFVLSEVVTHLYRKQLPAEAQAFVNAILAAADAGTHHLVHVSPDQFRRAWQMRQKYRDKPDISFVDFTSMIVMQDLGITDVFTGDVGVVHHGQGLALRLKPGDHSPGVHARLDDLQGHPPFDRLFLLGHVDHAHAALANLLEQLVGADDCAQIGSRLAEILQKNYLASELSAGRSRSKIQARA